jgi:hypothetical protein
LDAEFLLANVARYVEGWEFPKGTTTGFQLFTGPVANIGRLAIYAAGGVNYLSVGGATLGSESGPLDIIYVGNGGLSQLWAKHMNEIGGGQPNSVRPSIPDYSRLSPGALGGASLCVWGSRANRNCMRISADYLLQWRGATHSNFRATISIAG